MAKKVIKGTAIIYIRPDICDICEIIEENKEKIRELILKYIEHVSFRNAYDNYEFIAYGFDSVPTLILPGYRPFESIHPDHMMSEDSIVMMLEGLLLPQDVMHEKAVKRKEKGITYNKYKEILSSITGKEE